MSLTASCTAPPNVRVLSIPPPSGSVYHAVLVCQQVSQRNRRSQSSTYVRGKQIFRPSSVTVKRSPGQVCTTVVGNCCHHTMFLSSFVCPVSWHGAHLSQRQDVHQGCRRGLPCTRCKTPPWHACKQRVCETTCVGLYPDKGAYQVTSIGDTSIADMEFEAVRDLMGKQADTFPVRFTNADYS